MARGAAILQLVSIFGAILHNVDGQGFPSPQCLAPSGESCDWYKDCLEDQIPCENTEHAYAITYADHFCNLYVTNIGRFSAEGVTWVDAVRKCLQVTIAPILASPIPPTCEQIQIAAFASHTPCYLQPEPGVGFCSLPFLDQLVVFDTIKGAFLSAPGDSLTGVLEVMTGCVSSLADDVWDGVEDLLNRAVIKLKEIPFGDLFKRRRRRQAPPEPDTSIFGFANTIAEELIERLDELGITEEFISWWAIPGEPDLDAGTIDITLFIINKVALGLVNEETAQSPEAQSFNALFPDLFDILESEVENGSLNIETGFGDIPITSIELCDNSECVNEDDNSSETTDPDTDDSATGSDEDDEETGSHESGGGGGAGKGTGKGGKGKGKGGKGKGKGGNGKGGKGKGKGGNGKGNSGKGNGKGGKGNGKGGKGNGKGGKGKRRSTQG